MRHKITQNPIETSRTASQRAGWGESIGPSVRCRKDAGTDNPRRGSGAWVRPPALLLSEGDTARAAAPTSAAAAPGTHSAAGAACGLTNQTVTEHKVTTSICNVWIAARTSFATLPSGSIAT